MCTVFQSFCCFSSHTPPSLSYTQAAWRVWSRLILIRKCKGEPRVVPDTLTKNPKTPFKWSNKRFGGSKHVASPGIFQGRKYTNKLCFLFLRDRDNYQFFFFSKLNRCLQDSRVREGWVVLLCRERMEHETLALTHTHIHAKWR